MSLKCFVMNSCLNRTLIVSRILIQCLLHFNNSSIVFHRKFVLKGADISLSTYVISFVLNWINSF